MVLTDWEIIMAPDAVRKLFRIKPNLVSSFLGKVFLLTEFQAK